MWLSLSDSRDRYLWLPGLIAPKTPLYTRAAILVNFAKHLQHNGYAAGTIAGYLLHVRAAHKELLDIELVEGSALWKRYSTALTAEASNPQNSKHPVSVRLLQACVDELDDRPGLQCALTVAFFGLLRRKEWSAKSKKVARQWQLCRAHVKLFDKQGNQMFRTATPTQSHAGMPTNTADLNRCMNNVDHVQITVYRKGDGNKRGQNVHFYRTDSSKTRLCALSAVLTALAIAPDKNPDAPLFQEANGAYVRSDDVAKILKATAKKYGLEPGKYASHSLRRGGAQALRDAGFTEEFIKRFGAWHSDANTKYHSGPASESKGVADRMATAQQAH